MSEPTTVPSMLVARYFQLLVDRQFAEAERMLHSIKQRMKKTEWNRGYFRALYGMILTWKTNEDTYAFFCKLDLTDISALQKHRHEFLAHVRNKLHADFDRGFFSAWAECMQVLIRMNTMEVRVRT